MVSRLVIVSNRVALPGPGKVTAGGLAVAVKAALRNRTGVWFGWSGKIGPPKAPQVIHRHKVDYAVIDLSDVDFQEYYNGFANRVLWPILHYRVDLQEFSRADQSGYMRVNRLFAEKLGDLLREDDIIWVHDYHLMPLAQELRARGHFNPIGFFLHIPCAPPDILKTLPHHETIVGALTYYDLVGFQTERDRDNFAHYLEMSAADARPRPLDISDRWPADAHRGLSGRGRGGIVRAPRAQRRECGLRPRRQGQPAGPPPRPGRRPARLFEGNSPAARRLQPLSRGQPAVAIAGRPVADHAEKPGRHQGIQGHRGRGDRPDRKDQRALRRGRLDSDPLRQPALFAHGPGGALSSGQRRLW